MKREMAFVALVGMVFSAGAFAGVYSGGDGSAANPYQIKTAADWVRCYDPQRAGCENPFKWE